jgi:hypothetical protein
MLAARHVVKLALALAPLAAGPAAAQSPLPGMLMIQNEDASTLIAALETFGLPVEPGPGGPVDAAIMVDELACARTAGDAPAVTCRALLEGREYVNEDAGQIAAAVDILLAAAGRTTDVRITNLQCYRNSLPVSNAICAGIAGSR